MQNHFQSILDKVVDNKRVFGASFAIKKDDWIWQGASGNISLDQPYFIASTTKLFTTALVLKLKEEGKLNLNDKIGIYIDQSTLNKLHIYKGKEYSQDITIRHLMAHTSGLPDYFEDKGSNGMSLEDELIQGKDQFWTFDQLIERTKAIKPHFTPGKQGRAHYSDTNFQLLGKIIEIVSNKSFADNCNESVIQPLNLTKTTLYHDFSDKNPKELYYKNKELIIPKAMTSFGADGGIVSNSMDLLIFIEAFFTGKLFPSNYLPEMQVWNNIFFPMRSGIGIHLFRLPWIFNPFGTVPDFIGHSGLSGALAYYCPKERVFIAGTVNQVAHPDISFRTMIKLTQKISKT